MIYAIGVGSDPTYAHFVSETRRIDAPVAAVDLREVVAEGRWRLAVPDDGDSVLPTAEETHRLDPAASYFCRLSDLSALQDDVRQARRWQSLVTALTAWLDHIPGQVVNRPAVRADNGSKPLHEWSLANAGFAVPESLTTSEGDRLRAFAESGPTVVKAVSGVRVTCRLVRPEEFDGFDRRQGPVHLQRYIAGADVRAHVVGTRVHAEEIVSSGVDYRAAPREQVAFTPCELPASLAARMTVCTRDFGMAFAGWDFKVAGDGVYWCLEVNPMPGYDWYDRRLGGAITASLLGLLTRGAAQ
ncbi:ATP-grasp domain-containing protein [Nonomuraea sp. NPDC003707]